LKYILENEYPELLLLYDDPLLMKGYMRCLRIWQEAGLVKPISKREAIEKAISSDVFDSILIENGIPENLLSTVKKGLLSRINRLKMKRPLKEILQQLIDFTISRYGGGAYGRR